MIVYFIVFSITIVLVLFFNPYTKNKNLKIKFLLALGIIFSSLVIFIIIIVLLWNFSKDPREERAIYENGFKHVYFENNSGQNIKIYIDEVYFNYTLQQKIKIKDSLYLGYQSNNNFSGKRLSINIEDTISFPEVLNIHIKDSANKIIYQYDKNHLLENCKTEPIKLKSNNKLTAIAWILKIK